MKNDFIAGIVVTLILFVILIIVTIFTGCSGGWEVCGYEIDNI